MRQGFGPTLLHDLRVPLSPTHLRSVLEPLGVTRDRRVRRDQLRSPPKRAPVNRPRLQEFANALLIRSRGAETVGGDERFAFLDDEPCVAVDVAPDGADGDAAVVDVEGLEDGAREPVQHAAVAVFDVSESEVPVDAAAVHGFGVREEDYLGGGGGHEVSLLGLALD